MLKLSSVQVARRGHPLCAPIHLELKPGQGLQLMAPNGCGKSTLLKAIAGLYPYEGNIVKEPCAFLMHQSCLIPHFTVEELMGYWQSLYQSTLPESLLNAHLKQLGLYAQRKTATQYLSAGQARQLSLVSFLMMKRSLWLLDEPFNALDENAVNWWVQCMKAHLEKGGALIVVSHQVIPLNLSPFLLPVLEAGV